MGEPCPRCGKTWINGTCDDTPSRRGRCASQRGGPGNMNDNHELLAEVVERRRARPWMHVTSDGLPHFYVRTAPYDPDDLDMAAALRARDADLAAARTATRRLLDGCDPRDEEGAWVQVTYSRIGDPPERTTDPMSDAERAWLASVAATPTGGDGE